MHEESTNKISGLSGPGSGRFDWTASRFVPVRLEVSGESVILEAEGSRICLRGRLFSLDADGEHAERLSESKGEFTTLAMTVHAVTALFIRKATWFAGEWQGFDEMAVSATRLQDNAVFLRKGGVSFFISLDFPYSRILRGNIGYEPWEKVPQGASYACHSVSVGACRLSGIMAGRLDRSEVEALSAYVEQRYPLRFEKPVLYTASIANRLTEVRENRILYSMRDNPTWHMNPGLVEEEIRLFSQIGIEYYQVFEGMFDWPDRVKTAVTVRKAVDQGKRKGVRIVDYATPQGPYCSFFNYFFRDLNKPEWAMLSRDGRPLGRHCLGCRGYADYLRESICECHSRYGIEGINFDMLLIEPCYAKNHGHPLGDVYSQVRGMTDVMGAIAGISPDYLVHTDSGNWLDFMPKLLWYTPHVYLTDPHAREYVQGLNILKILGDWRREQMVSVHDSHFVPFRSFTNCEYYAFPRSRTNDLREFEYSLLQSLSVTPNLCVAEVRPFLNRIPSENRKYCMGFWKRWIRFLQDNFDLWKRTIIAGGSPGSGDCEIYAHIKGDRGYVCLVNQNPYPVKAGFTLDGAIGLDGGKAFEIYELYPGECLMEEQPLPYASFGSGIVCKVPPHGVRYLQVKPYAPTDGIRVYGWKTRILKKKNGYAVALKAPQGATIPLGIVLPGESLEEIAVSQAPSVPMYTFSAGGRIVEKSGNTARIEVVLPREKTPRELTRWKVSPEDRWMELPAEGCGFLGALVSGLYDEEYEVRVELRTRACGETGLLPGSCIFAEDNGYAPAAAGKQSFTTRFEIPFIESIRFGVMPGWGDDAVVELDFKDPTRVKSLEAYLNGVRVDVLKYRNPKKYEWFTYYVELTGNAEPGETELRLEVEWAGADK